MIYYKPSQLLSAPLGPHPTPHSFPYASEFATSILSVLFFLIFFSPQGLCACSQTALNTFFLPEIPSPPLVNFSHEFLEKKSFVLLN